MNVLGGIYRERCLFPARDDIVGSGLRGAALLQAVCPEIHLYGAVDAANREALNAIVGGRRLGATITNRDEPVEFAYFTPLSTPAINGARSRTTEVLEVEGEATMAFRMIENGDVRVRSTWLVLDPQQPRDLGPLELDWIEAEHLAIVANSDETAALGEVGAEASAEQLAAAARTILKRYGAEVVVVKRGAQGAIVVTADDATEVGVFPTERVYPIGSGDAFATGFCWAWAVDRQDPVSAARLGSRVAAGWCATGKLQLDPGVFTEDSSENELPSRVTHVYLAAPFFSLAERWLVDLVRDSLRNLGAEVFSPCHDVGVGGDEVARVDIEGLEACDSVLALLDGDDPGTVFEAGWARAHGKPVVAFARQPDAEGGKMLRGTGAELHDDLSTAVYRSIWAGMRLAS